MAKKVTGYVKLQIQAGKATPAPPVGPALGQHGVNIMDFTKQFNARTAQMGDYIIPVQREDCRQGRSDHPCSDHCLFRQIFQLHYEDPAGTGPHQEGPQSLFGFRRAEQEESRNDHQGSGS